MRLLDEAGRELKVVSILGWVLGLLSYTISDSWIA